MGRGGIQKYGAPYGCVRRMPRDFFFPALRKHDALLFFVVTSAENIVSSAHLMATNLTTNSHDQGLCLKFYHGVPVISSKTLSLSLMGPNYKKRAQEGVWGDTVQREKSSAV